MTEPSARPRTPRALRLRPSLLLALASLAVAAGFLVSMLAATDGHVAPQVVDLYVVCQYARAMAEGHPFQYNPGEPPSTGATSLLHTALLALAHRLGLRGEALVGFAIALGASFYVGSAMVARRVALRLAGPCEGLLAGALVVLGGPVVWGFLYGSDIALFMFLSLWLLERMLAAWQTGVLRGAILAGTLLALARPEALILALALGLALTLGPGRRSRRWPLAPWAPLGVALALAAFNRILTGSWLASSVADKSLVASYGASAALGVAAGYALDVARGLLLGFYPPQAPVGFGPGWASLYFPPLGLLLVLLALVRAPEPGRRAARWWAGAVAVTVLAISPNLFLGVHFNRYVLWAVPGLLALAAVGLGELASLLSPADPLVQRALLRAGAGLVLSLGALSTLRVAVIYGDMAGEVYARDVAAADWIRTHLPPGSAMANLATSVEYLTGHRNINLHGVTSPAFFGNRATERDAAALEVLGRLPAEQRPPYLITTRSGAQTYATVRAILDGEPLFRTLGPSDPIEVYRTRYDLLGRNARHYLPETERAVAGLGLVDALNVCDGQAEAAHRYRLRSRLGEVPLGGTVRIERYSGAAGTGGVAPGLVADAGRAIVGGESFDVATTPGRDLVLVLRTAAQTEATVLRPGSAEPMTLEFAQAGMVVRANGQPAGRLTFAPRPGWDEQVVRVPGALIRSQRTRLDLSGRYASFYYWFYQ